MPDAIDRQLEALLAYPEQESTQDLFVVDVMRKVRRERRVRRLILWLFGSIGAVFGVLGAVMLSESLARLFTDSLSSMFWIQLPLFAVGAAAFYHWFMNDDLALSR